MRFIYFSELAEFAHSAAEIVYSDAVFIIDLLGIPPAVEIKIGSYAGSRFTHGIGALVETKFLTLILCSQVCLF